MSRDDVQRAVRFNAAKDVTDDNIIPNQMNKSKKKSTSSIVDIISWWDIQDIYAK